MKKITFLLILLMAFLVCPNVMAQFGCDSAVVITDGYTEDNITTPGSGGVEDWNDNPDGSCGVSGFYWDDDVYLYEYTAGAVDEEISMTVYTRNTYTGLGIFANCDGTSFSNCLGAVGAGFTSDFEQSVGAVVGAGETVYIAVGQWGSPNDLDFDVTDFTATPLVNPPNCDAVLTLPADGATGVLVDDVTLEWDPATGGASSYLLSVGTSPGGVDILDNFENGSSTSYDLGALDFETTYYVTITPQNSNGDASGCTEYSFTTEDSPMVAVDCSAGPTEVNFCYVSGTVTEYIFTSTDGSALNLVVNEGQVESGWDEFVVLDSDGTELYNGYGAAGDISGLSFQTSGDQITIQVNADGVFDCASQGYTPIDVSVTCATCIMPQATFEVVSDCLNGAQFLVDVDLASIGDATDLDISDNQGNTQTVNAAGVYTFGPYANGTDVDFTVENNQDANCVVTSSTLTQDECLEIYVDCAEGTPEVVNFCYENSVVSEYIFASTDGSGITINITEGQVENNFDEFIVLDSDGTELYNGYGVAGDISGLVFQSSGDQITVRVTPDFTVSCQANAYTPINIEATCSTCLNPQANYTVVSDCVNGAQFLIDVEITSLGDATDLDISDNQGNTQTASAVGVYTFGPYTNGTLVDFTVENNQDSNCIISSDELTQEFCLDNYVECGTPINTSFCYENSEPLTFTYTSDDGSPLTVEVNGGFVQNNIDEFIVYDTDGTELYNGYGNEGDLTGLEFQSTGDEISVMIDPSAFTSCASNGYDPIDLTVFCASCINPAAEFTVVEDCLNGPQFNVEVDLTSLGDATDVDITDNQGNTQTASSTGVYTFGPYTNGILVDFTVVNNEDATCDISVAGLTQAECLNNYVDCTAGPINTNFCYENGETTEFIYTSTDGSALNLTVNEGQVESGWDEFIVLDSDGTELYNGYGTSGDISGLTFQSSGDTITIQVAADGVIGCQSNGYTPIDVTVSCATCVNPQATYTVVEDCLNGAQFLVDVEITSLGDATDLDISDNQGDTQTASATGVFTFGPYANGTDVDFTVENNQDINCVITSSTLTQEYCPVNYFNCADGVFDSSFCYEDYETVQLSYVSDDGSNINLTVNSGLIYTFGGDFQVLDTDGTVLYSGTGDGGDLSGIEVQSTGDTITVVYTAGFYACGESGYTGIDLSVECSTCLNPSLSYEVISDCASGVNQFFVDVTVDDLGSATSLTLTDNQGSTAIDVTATDTFNFGPFANNTEVIFTAVNDQDNSCSIESPIQTQTYCPQPPIIIDENTYTIEELVVDVLIDNPCAQVSNVTSSTGSDFGSVNGISYFDYNDSDFPLENGIVLSSGDVNDLPGPAGAGGFNTAWPGDPDLDDIIAEIEGGMTGFNESNDASIIEFDFVPFIEEISFDFLFASNEYGTFQCNYSDPFGFFLTDEDGNTVNIAIVPGTTDPIAVTTVRDNTHNAGCASVNESYFDVFYGLTGMEPLASPVNMLGRTVVMTASAQVTPGAQYHIKLAVGDRADSSFNSSTFLAAGSFELGDFTLGEDITIDDGTADTCSGDAITLDIGLENTNGADITWYQDGSLVEDANGDPVNTPTLEVTEGGEYAVSVIYFGSCALSDVINVEFLPNPEVDLGEDIITICEGGATVIDGTPTNLSELDDVTYAWYLDGNEIAGETNATINVTEAGEYTVEVTGYQCTVSDSVVVEQVNYQVDFSNVSIGCTEEGDTNSFVLEPNIIGVPADEMDDLTYTWAPGGEQTSSITITEDGQYTVTVSYLGCFETATYNAEFTEAPQIDLGADAIVCSGATYSLDATPSNASDFDSLTYSWLDADGLEVSTDAMPSLPGGVYTVLVEGEFTNNGMTYSCVGTDEIIIEDVTYNIDLGGDQEFCGMDPYTITATVIDEDTTNATYQWSDSSGPIAGETGSTLTVMDSDTYTVEVTINGCADTASVDLLFDLSPQIDLGSDVTTCDLTPYTIDATPINMPASDVVYTWSLDGTELISETGATLDPSGYGFGTYTVTAVSVNDSDGSCEVSASVVYTEAAIDLTITATQGETAITIPYCSDSEPVPSHTITFTASADGAPTGVNYQWYLDGTAIAGATDASYTVTYEEEGVFIEDYSVEVSYDSCLFTSGSTPVDVTIEPYENGCVISQGISPSNVDGFNDCLDLTFLDDRTGIESLKVYNRYGRLVFERDNYVNSFCGQDINGDELPSGTYYYVLVLEGEDPVFGRMKKSWVYINREAN